VRLPALTHLGDVAPQQTPSACEPRPLSDEPNGNGVPEPRSPRIADVGD
jgi:hypothetical protein